MVVQEIPLMDIICIWNLVIGKSLKFHVQAFTFELVKNRFYIRKCKEEINLRGNPLGVEMFWFSNKALHCNWEETRKKEIEIRLIHILRWWITVRKEYLLDIHIWLNFFWSKVMVVVCYLVVMVMVMVLLHSLRGDESREIMFNSRVWLISFGWC